jgi:hypothetical protein
VTEEVTEAMEEVERRLEDWRDYSRLAPRAVGDLLVIHVRRLIAAVNESEGDRDGD